MSVSAVPTARSVAATVISRVIADGAFAAAALSAELDRMVQLDPRDRALATELVYGTLRHHGFLEDRINRHAKRGLNKLDPIVRAHLVIAAYQLLVLTRIPSFAAVSEAVTAVRSFRGQQVGGFVNAVLRKVAAEPKPSLDRAVLDSLAPGLRAALVRSLGEEGASSLVSGTEAPALGLRVEDATQRDAWLEKLRTARPNATFEAGKVSPHAILAWSAGKVDELPGYDEGAWTPQEEGSQLIALALDARPGEVVLDACAGRGNKTGLIARRTATDAADSHPKKLDRLRQELERIRIAPHHTFAVDWSKGTGEAKAGTYDRVLIDAPCSGTGTMRRRPELMLRRSEADLIELATLQRAILKHASSTVKPGGYLIYAVCSILREEAEDVIAGLEGFVPVPFEGEAARALAGENTTLRLLPQEHATDGYFLASLRRREVL